MMLLVKLARLCEHHRGSASVVITSTARVVRFAPNTSDHVAIALAESGVGRVTRGAARRAGLIE